MTVREKASANVEARFQKIMKSSEGIEIQIQTRQERIEALTEKIKTQDTGFPTLQIPTGKVVSDKRVSSSNLKMTVVYLIDRVQSGLQIFVHGLNQLHLGFQRGGGPSPGGRDVSQIGCFDETNDRLQKWNQFPTVVLSPQQGASNLS